MQMIPGSVAHDSSAPRVRSPLVRKNPFTLKKKKNLAAQAVQNNSTKPLVRPQKKILSRNKDVALSRMQIATFIPLLSG